MLFGHQKCFYYFHKSYLFHIVAIFELDFCLGLTELYNNENYGNDDDEDSNYKLNIASDYVSKINLTLNIISFQEEDFDRIHYVTVMNDIGSENYTIEFVSSPSVPR